MVGPEEIGVVGVTTGVFSDVIVLGEMGRRVMSFFEVFLWSVVADGRIELAAVEV